MARRQRAAAQPASRAASSSRAEPRRSLPQAAGRKPRPQRVEQFLQRAASRSSRERRSRRSQRRRQRSTSTRPSAAAATEAAAPTHVGRRRLPQRERPREAASVDEHARERHRNQRVARPARLRSRVDLADEHVARHDRTAAFDHKLGAARSHAIGSRDRRRTSGSRRPPTDAGAIATPPQSIAACWRSPQSLRDADRARARSSTGRTIAGRCASAAAAPNHCNSTQKATDHGHHEDRSRQDAHRLDRHRRDGLEHVRPPDRRRASRPRSTTARKDKAAAAARQGRRRGPTRRRPWPRQSDVVFAIVGFPQRRARSDPRRATARWPAARPATILVDMTTSEPSLAVEICRGGQGEGRAQRRCPGLRRRRRGPRSAAVDHDRRRQGRRRRAAALLARRWARRSSTRAAAGAGQHTKMVNQILIAAEHDRRLRGAALRLQGRASI